MTDFEFSDKAVTISSGKQRVTYTYADPSMIVTAPTKDINFPETSIEFNLTSEHLSMISKAGSVLQMPEIAIVGEDGVISIRAIDSKNPSADVFSLDVGEIDNNLKFKVVFRPENLKVIQAEYKVSLTDQGIAKFETQGLTYFVATEA